MFTRATIVVTACLGLLLGGCYLTDKPIITRDIAVELPGLEGFILVEYGDGDILSFDEQSMSYRAGKRQTDGSIKWDSCGAFLVMPLQDEWYWFQCGPEIQENGQEAYMLVLFQFEIIVKQSSKPHVPDMTEDEMRQFAGQYGVTMSQGGFKLSGSRDDILAFLKAHADVPLKEVSLK